MVQLYEPRGHQGAYIDGQVERLQTEVADYNNTNVGIGKTPITFMLARRLNLPLFVVGPKVGKEIWEGAAEDQGVEIFFESYGKLATNSSNKITHGLLTRETIRTETPDTPSADTPEKKNMIKKGPVYRWVHYYPTELLQTIIQAGALFVFDEVHDARNDNQTSQMVLAICQEVMFSGSPSRVVLLSATPVGSAEQYLNIANVLGYFGYGNRHVHPGMDMELVYRNGTTSEAEYKANKKKYEIKGSSMEIQESRAKAVLDLVIRPISSACPREESEWKHVITDTYYAINPLLHYKATTNLNDLEAVLKDKELGDGDVDVGKKKKAAAHTLETCKIPVVLASVMNILRSVEGSQIIIGAIHTSTIMYLTGMIRAMGYDVIRYDGKSTAADRRAGIAAFNAGEVRVFVMNVVAGGTGISLHDTEGGRPRFMFRFPNFRALESIQFAGRAYRSGVASDVRTRGVYTQIENEVRMRASAVKAGDAIAGILDDDEAEDRIMPASYTAEVPEEVQLTVAGDIVSGVNSVEEAERVVEAHLGGKKVIPTTKKKKARATATSRKTPVARKIKGQKTVRTKIPSGRR